MTHKKSKVGKTVKTGLAISAVAGAAYMLFGPDGKKHQKELHEWAMKIKKEVKKDVGAVKSAIKEMKGPAKAAAKRLAKKAGKKASAKIKRAHNKK
jgi:hypothetical protein